MRDDLIVAPEIVAHAELERRLRNIFGDAPDAMIDSVMVQGGDMGNGDARVAGEARYRVPQAGITARGGDPCIPSLQLGLDPDYAAISP